MQHVLVACDDHDRYLEGVDFDVVDHSNLQRQIIHGTKDVGRPKLQSAKDRLSDINPHIRIDTYEVALKAENALDIFKD